MDENTVQDKPVDEPVEMPGGGDTRTGNVVIEFVEEQTKIQVDMSKLTWGDARLLDKMRTDPNITEQERERIIHSIVSNVTGKDMDTLPLSAVTELLKAIGTHVGRATTAKN